MSNHLTLGTRGSALALCQAEMTEAALAGHCDLTRQVIVTTGDKRTDVPLAAVAAASGIVDKGVFIKELEVALLDGVIDFAVHSLKDVPTILEPEFEVCAVLPRAPTGDVLITRGPSLDELAPGATIGTSSVRRKLQLLHLRPDLKVIDIRGNVPTRLQKVVDQPELDGTILAEAGLVRLGYNTAGILTTENGDALAAHLLDSDEFLPAAGQGAVAMEILKSNDRARQPLAAINHEETMVRITAERHFLALLQAGCDTPVGVDSKVIADQLHLTARVFSEDPANNSHQAATAVGPVTSPESTAKELFEALK